MATPIDIRADLQRAREYQLDDLTELGVLLADTTGDVPTPVARRRRARLVFEIARREELMAGYEARLSGESVSEPDSGPADAGARKDPDRVVDDLFSSISQFTSNPRNRLLIDLVRSEVQKAAKDPNALRDRFRPADKPDRPDESTG